MQKSLTGHKEFTTYELPLHFRIQNYLKFKSHEDSESLNNLSWNN